MTTPRALLIVFTLGCSAPAAAQAPSTLTDAVKEVALDKLMSALAEAALKLPENAQATKVKARLVRREPRVGDQAVLESFTVATALNAFSLFLVPSEIGFGQSFEYCEAGANKETARKYVQHMLGTYEPASFAQIAKRPGCAKAMLGYLEAP